jgi:hypothetical protein
VLYVVLSDGTVDELADAVKPVAVDGVLACYDAQGQLVRSYDRNAVAMFGHDEQVKAVAEKLRLSQGANVSLRTDSDPTQS